MTINIGINGMGRIGRMVIRAIIESQNKNIKIKLLFRRSQRLKILIGKNLVLIMFLNVLENLTLKKNY